MDSMYRYQRDVKEGRVKFRFNVVFYVLAPAFIAMLVPFIYYNLLDVEESRVASNLIFAFTSIPMTFSLFIMQKYKLLGAYGEVVILLIPTLIWLLPEYPDVMKGAIIVGMAFFGVSILLLLLTVLFLKRKDVHKAALSSMVVAKIMFLIAGLLTVLAMSITLIHWGDEGMHWLTPRGSVTKNVKTESWVIFIVVSAVVSAALLLIEGLFSSYIVIEYQQLDPNTTEIDLGNWKKIKKTIKKLKGKRYKK